MSFNFALFPGLKSLFDPEIDSICYKFELNEIEILRQFSFGWLLKYFGYLISSKTFSLKIWSVTHKLVVFQEKYLIANNLRF